MENPLLKLLGRRKPHEEQEKTNVESSKSTTVSPILLTFWGAIFAGVIIFVLNGLFFPPERTEILASPSIITSPAEIPLSAGGMGEPNIVAEITPTTAFILPSKPVEIAPTTTVPVTTTTTSPPPATLVQEEPRRSRSIMVTGSCPINTVCEQAPTPTTSPSGEDPNKSPVVSFVEEVVEILTNPENPRDETSEEVAVEKPEIQDTSLIAELTSRISIWNNQVNMPLGLQNLILESKASNKQIVQFHIRADGHLALDTPEEICYNRIEQAIIDINLRDGLRPILYEGDPQSAITSCQEAQFDLKKVEL